MSLIVVPAQLQLLPALHLLRLALHRAQGRPSQWRPLPKVPLLPDKDIAAIDTTTPIITSPFVANQGPMTRACARKHNYKVKTRFLLLELILL